VDTSRLDNLDRLDRAGRRMSAGKLRQLSGGHCSHWQSVNKLMARWRKRSTRTSSGRVKDSSSPAVQQSSSPAVQQSSSSSRQSPALQDCRLMGARHASGRFRATLAERGKMNAAILPPMLQVAPVSSKSSDKF